MSTGSILSREIDEAVSRVLNDRFCHSCKVHRKVVAFVQPNDRICADCKKRQRKANAAIDKRRRLAE